MPSPKLEHCSTCKKSIYWVTTENGKKMPIDYRPVEDGNIIFIMNLAHVVKADEEVPPGTKRWKSHFATCPQASAHRKKKVREL